MGNICRQVSIDSNSDANEQKSKITQYAQNKFTKSSMKDLLINGLVANASHHQIKLCITWNQHKLQEQLIAQKMIAGASLGIKNLAPSASFQTGGEYTIQQNKKKYDKMARHIIQPGSIKKFQIKKHLLSSCSLSISIILQNNQQKLIDEISVNCIQDLQWIILCDSTSSKMSRKQYEFINTNYQKGYYDPRNSCKHQQVQQINKEQVEGCFCCLKLKQFTIGGNKWFMCNGCLKVYCQKCYEIKNFIKVREIFKGKQVHEYKRKQYFLHQSDSFEKKSEKKHKTHRKKRINTTLSAVSCLSQQQQNPEQQQINSGYIFLPQKNYEIQQYGTTKSNTKIVKNIRKLEDQYLSER